MLIYYMLLLTAVLPGILNAWPKKGDRAASASQKRNSGLPAVFYLALMCILLVAVSSFRYAIGFDYYSYRSIYLETSKLSAGEIIKRQDTEIFFYLLNKAFSSMGFSYTAFLTAVNIFIHGTAMWFIRRYSKIPWLSVYFYVSLQFFAHSMNLVRQSIALSFFLLAFSLLVRRRFLPFAAVMVAGGLFHNSLLLMIPLYFLLPLKNTVKNMCLFFAAAALLYLFLPEIMESLIRYLPNKYSAYEGSFYWQGNSFRYVVLPTIYFAGVLLFRNRLLENNSLNAIWVNSAFYTAMINLFITRHFILERFSVYLFIFSIVLIPEIVNLHMREGNRTPGEEELDRASCRPMFFVLIACLMYGLCYFGFAAKEGFHNVYPYVSLMDKAVSSGLTSGEP